MDLTSEHIAKAEAGNMKVKIEAMQNWYLH